MGYKKLEVSENVPPVVRDHIIAKLDILLADALTMLIRPTDAEGYAGLNFSIALNLLSVVDGIAQLIYPRTPEHGDAFKTLLRDKYNWGVEGVDDDMAKKNVEDLWWFRNNLVHAIGVDVTTVKGKQLRYSREHKTWSISRNPPRPETVGIVEEFLNSNTRGMTVLRSGVPSVPGINLTGLYVGIRQMVLALTRDAEIMEQCEGYLKHMGFK